MRILFAGTPDIAVPSLRALVEAENIEVVAVLTRPDAPSGRGRKLKPSAVKVCAQELGIPVYEDNPNSEEWLATLHTLHVEAAAVVAYGRILRQPVLDAVEYGWFNLHFSRLPQLRGAAPAQRAIWQGMRETGATVFQLTAGMDEGPILEQSRTQIHEHETAGVLLERMGREQAALLVEALQKVAQGSAQFTPQRVQGASIAAKITHEDAHIDLTQSAAQVAAQIRACSPNPGAWAMLMNEPPTSQVTDDPDATTDAAVSTEQPVLLRILNASAVPQEQVADIAQRILSNTGGCGETQTAGNTDNADNTDNANSSQELNIPVGRIIADKKHVWVVVQHDVTCSGSEHKSQVQGGLVQLLEVQAQGKKRMVAADWARGARLSVYARLQ